MEPDYSKILLELEFAKYCEEFEILKRHFEQFEKDIRMQCALDEMQNIHADEYGPPNRFDCPTVLTPTCPGIADKATVSAPPGSLLEAIRNGAKNPIVSNSNVECHQCNEAGQFCNYCIRNLEE